MSVTIHLGWWVLPALITVAAYAIAVWRIPAAQPSSYLPDFGPAIVGFITLSLASIASLLAWLVWALAGGAA